MDVVTGLVALNGKGKLSPPSLISVSTCLIRKRGSKYEVVRSMLLAGKANNDVLNFIYCYYVGYEEKVPYILQFTFFQRDMGRMDHRLRRAFARFR